MDRDYLNKILRSKSLTAMQYRIILTLITGEYTKAQLAEELGVSQQSINPVTKQLLELDLIKVVKTVGRNQYLTCNSDEIIYETKVYNRELEDAQELYNEFKEFSYETVDNLDIEEFNKYKDAILLICKQELYTTDSLVNQDSFFSNLLKCENDDITSSLYNIRDNLSSSNGINTTSWAYSIGQDYGINVEYTFINKDITMDYIDNLDEKTTEQEAWETIVNEDVKITNITLI